MYKGGSDAVSQVLMQWLPLFDQLLSTVDTELFPVLSLLRVCHLAATLDCDLAVHHLSTLGAAAYGRIGTAMIEVLATARLH
jgi:hypothetical protein